MRVDLPAPKDVKKRDQNLLSRHHNKEKIHSDAVHKRTWGPHDSQYICRQQKLASWVSEQDVSWPSAISFTYVRGLASRLHLARWFSHVFLSQPQTWCFQTSGQPPRAKKSSDEHAESSNPVKPEPSKIMIIRWSAIKNPMGRFCWRINIGFCWRIKIIEGCWMQK